MKAYYLFELRWHETLSSLVMPSRYHLKIFLP